MQKLLMALIVHVIAKFVLTFDACCKASGEVFPRVNQIWKSIVRKKNEFMQWHKCDCLFGDMISVVSIYYHYVPRKLKDLMIMWSLGGNLLLNKLSATNKPQKKLNLIHKVTPMSLLHILCTITLLLIGKTCSSDCV
jgi:hypothetical protein